MGQLQWLRNLQGVTDPWLVARYGHDDGDDGPQLLVLKHFREGDLQGRIAEYVAGKVAEELKIGAPKIELVEVTSGFLKSLEYLSGFAPVGLQQAVPNLHVAVAYDEHAAPMTDDPAMTDGLADRIQAADIIAVDTLVQNGDRHIGNLLIRPVASGRYPRHVLVPIDWSHALCNASHHDLLRGSSWDRGLIARSPLTSVILGPKDFVRIRKRIEKFRQDDRARALVKGLPREWDLPLRWRRRLEVYLSNRIATTLHELNYFDDPERAFPNWQYSIRV